MSAVGGCGLVEDVSDLLGAVVGDFDTDMRLICREGLTESFLLAGGACVCEARRRSRMWQEGIACASAVFGRVLLDAAAYLTWGITGECDDVKGAWHTGCVLELVVNRVLISLEGGSSVAIRTPARKSFPRSASQFLYTVPDLPGTRSNKRAVGCSFPRVVHDAGELAGPGGVGLGGATRLSSTLGARTPAKAGGVIRCGLQARLDMGPHGVPRGCQLSSQSCNGGSLDAQLSDRPADRPRPQTRPGSTHRVVLLDKGRNPAGAFAPHPASFMPPDPHRDPGPRRVDHLHHHTPVTVSNHPTTRAASTTITGLYAEHQSALTPSGSNQMEALQVDEQITPTTTTKRHRAAGRVKHRPRS